ncbi:hypothetical protein GCM10011351_29420 [Paraliobacillus quinghaiensis]|uniref:Uncharacterized protein n=1 Tax=Paraliobacillus quinghaiensis TaxID=470815 RepID=A0A917TXE5_9BACI|nr:hypothetical protein GCM10011351_29420 [Paraliobacillus quinghaiensis]
MEATGFIILIIIVVAIGFVVWTISSINEKLDLLVRIQLKRDEIHFEDKNMEEDAEKYRDN